MSLFKDVRVIIFAIVLILGTIFLAVSGLKYGLDFSGGTQFIVTLDKEVDVTQMERVQSTISQRLDWTGLKDVKVTSWDNKYVGIEVAESDPEQVAKIEEILQKQGRFECLYENKVLFTGDEVVEVSKNATKGFGISKVTEGYSWQIPFVLNAKAARSFSESIFRKCVLLPDGTSQCPSTYFFIDRPLNSLILISEDTFDEDNYLANNAINELYKNSQLNYIKYSSLDENKILEISNFVKDNNIETIIYESDLNISSLSDLSVKFNEISKEENEPWSFKATGLKTIIGLSESITNQNVSSIDSPNFKVYMELVINGGAQNLEDAQNEVNELYAILNSGSLPVGIESISKETVSPILGQNILNKLLLAGIIALFVIALILFIRYRNWKIALPMFLVGLSEVYLTLAFAALINWQLDLSAIAGILAAVGTGVDDQIILTDELMKKKEEQEERSLLARVKRAFFIIWMSAATLTITMLPMIFVFGGIPKLVGFAITTLIGVAIGVFITRPAFASIIKHILSK
jgi:preprotein translocase subunit SecD